MLILNNYAQCNTCIRRLRAKQPNGTEDGEKWTCPAYPEGISTDITVKAKKCKQYVEDK